MRFFFREKQSDFGKQYRNEWKYICTENELAVLEERLRAVLDRDSHSESSSGGYEIHSLYFDDLKNSCARENDAGTSKRFKYRIRYYGSESSLLKLERKEKRYGRCYKETCQLSQEQYFKIISGRVSEVFWETDIPLLQQFCTQCMLKEFRPKVIIDYQRHAYVDSNINLRITLDKNITVSDTISGFLTGEYYGIPIQETNMHILEVKYDAILPSYINRLISDPCLVQTAFSKYYLGKKKLLEMGRR